MGLSGTNVEVKRTLLLGKIEIGEIVMKGSTTIKMSTRRDDDESGM